MYISPSLSLPPPSTSRTFSLKVQRHYLRGPKCTRTYFRKALPPRTQVVCADFSGALPPRTKVVHADFSEALLPRTKVVHANFLEGLPPRTEVVHANFSEGLPPRTEVCTSPSIALSLPPHPLHHPLAKSTFHPPPLLSTPLNGKGDPFH